MAVRHASRRSPEKEWSMSSGQRRWAVAPGGICARRDPRISGQTPIARSTASDWDTVAARLCDAVLGAAAVCPAASHGEPAMRVQLAAQRGGAGNPV